MKKLYLFLYIVIVFCVLGAGQRAYASLEITEIMYDPKGSNANHQWIEVYNDGSSSVDVDGAKWRFSDGASHYMNDKSSFSIPSQTFFIITGDKNTFLSDYSGFTGLVIDTVMALDKDGGVVSLINDGGAVSTVSYLSSQGGAEDDKSLQKINNAWIAAVPTPGSANQTDGTISTNTSDKNTETSTSATSSGSSTVIKKELPPPKLISEIVVSSLATVGVDLSIKAKVTYGPETYMVGRLVWNFGDGTTFTQDKVEPFTHRYSYAGDYVLTLSYYKYAFQMAPADAVDRVVISVAPPGVVISSVGAGADPYIELDNTSKYEMELSDWILKSGEALFIIPSGTVILPNKKLIFGSAITHFVMAQEVSLLRPSGQVASVSPNVKKDSYVYVNSPKTENALYINKSASGAPSASPVLDLSTLNQEAQVKNAEVAVPFEIFLVILLVALGISVTYFFIRKKNNEGEESLFGGDDMRIIE